jgi:hypothetical protein
MNGLWTRARSRWTVRGSVLCRHHRLPLQYRREVRADLPPRSIRAGIFKVRASGGVDVGPFESSVQIGSPIQVTKPIPPGIVFSSLRAMTVNWTAGDEDTWVTLRVVRHWGSLRLGASLRHSCHDDGQRRAA